MFWGWGLLFFIIFMSAFGKDLLNFQSLTIQQILAYIIMVLVTSLLFWVWFGTGYKIEENYIIIKSGPFKNIIDIKDIQKINKAKAHFDIPLSGPTLSMNRLEIFHGTYHDVITISPEKEKDFIKLLLIKKPPIQIDKNINMRD